MFNDDLSAMLRIAGFGVSAIVTAKKTVSSRVPLNIEMKVC